MVRSSCFPWGCAPLPGLVGALVTLPEMVLLCGFPCGYRWVVMSSFAYWNWGLVNVILAISSLSVLQNMFVRRFHST